MLLILTSKKFYLLANLTIQCYLYYKNIIIYLFVYDIKLFQDKNVM